MFHLVPVSLLHILFWKTWLWHGTIGQFLIFSRILVKPRFSLCHAIRSVGRDCYDITFDFFLEALPPICPHHTHTHTYTHTLLIFYFRLFNGFSQNIYIIVPSFPSYFAECFPYLLETLLLQCFQFLLFLLSWTKELGCISPFYERLIQSCQTLLIMATISL